MNDRAEILQQLQMSLRTPFQVELAKLLACAPDESSVRAWAQKNIDRWAQAVAILTKASGVADRFEVSGTISSLVGLAVDVQNWPESRFKLEEERIKAELRELEQRFDRATLPADDDDESQRPD
jgi:hypothetical protein